MSARSATAAVIRRLFVPVAGCAALLGAAFLALTHANFGHHAANQPDKAEAAPARKSTFAERRVRALSRDAERRALTPERDGARAQVERLGLERARATAQLNKQIATRSRELVADRWVLPLSGYRLTGRFGASSSLWSSAHTGLDFAAPPGTPIRSVSRGVVAESGSAGAYGLRTVVTLPDRTEIWYCHQQATSVTPGTSVVAGQVIGEVGTTGNVTGPHLHLEVRPNGNPPVDPASALQQRGLAL